MRILVTLENIDKYDLVKLTGFTKEELLHLASDGLYLQIPDVEGGDTETPEDRNVFAHWDELPEPEGYVHEQKTSSILEDPDDE